MLEGGYNVPILAGSVAAHLHALGASPGQAELGSVGTSARASFTSVEAESNDPDGIRTRVACVKGMCPGPG